MKSHRFIPSVLALACSAAWAQETSILSQEPSAAPAVRERAVRPEPSEREERQQPQQRQRQQTPQTPQPDRKLPDAKTMQQVTVSGKISDDDQRRLSTASKMVFGREELDRNGDSTLGEILKRLPGVTMGGRPGRGGDIRMRGLGSGYTQILLNGERAPGGFSLDSLSPDQVERIEIYRAPVAEFSTRAIAGTINVVLREDFQIKTTTIRLIDTIEGPNQRPNVSFTHPINAGPLSILLNGMVGRSRIRNELEREEIGLDPQGRVVLDQTQYEDSWRVGRAVQLTPRVNYRFANGDSLMAQLLVSSNSGEGQGNYRLEQRVGPPAPYTSATTSGDSTTSAARLFGTYQHRFEQGQRFTLRFGGGLGKSDSDTLRYQYGPTGDLRNLMTDENGVNDHSGSLSGKYNMTVAGSHTITTGWDAEFNARSQTRTSLDNGRPQFIESGENLSAKSRRLAAFAQDEWDITPQWGTSFGLRWEGITTTSERLGDTIRNVSNVWSPVAHVVYRIPGAKKDQIRASITHSYRPPGLPDLIALPTLSPDNSPTRPDRIGNRDLKPELSTGVDMAFEHYLTQSGIMSISVFNRSIENLIRRQTSLEQTAQGLRWVSQPKNIGKAIASGVELEAKFQLTEFFPSGPAMDVRSNYSHFWSRVDGVPGPNNRLDAQPSQTANFGLDYRPAGIPLTLGASVNWTPGYDVRSSLTQSSSQGIKRQLDAYTLWKFTSEMQLRIGANNLTASDYFSSGNITQGGVNQSVYTTARTYRTFNVRFEMKI